MCLMFTVGERMMRLFFVVILIPSVLSEFPSAIGDACNASAFREEILSATDRVEKSPSVAGVLSLINELSHDDQLAIIIEVEAILRKQGISTSSSDDLDLAEGKWDGTFPWATALFLVLCFKAILYLLHVMTRERHRFLGRHAFLQGSFVAYLKYRFGYWYAWTPGAAGIVLGVLSLTILLSGGFLLRFLTGEPLSTTLWAAWLWVVDPDGGGAAETVHARAVGVICSCGGMLIFALLMSVVSAGFEESLHSLRQGIIPVVEANHIVVLGWSPLALQLILELCLAAEGRGGSVITILATLPKPDVEEILRDSGIDFRCSTVIVRSGQAHKPEDLKLVAIETAAKVVILSDHSLSREDADSKMLNILLTLFQQQWPRQGTCVVECRLGRNQNLFKSLCHAKTEVITTGDFVGNLMVQSSAQDGLAGVMNDTFRFEGDEFYIHHVDGLVGETFHKAHMKLGAKGVIALGLAIGGNMVQLLPPLDTIIKSDDKFILLAEDASLLPDKVDLPVEILRYIDGITITSQPLTLEPSPRRRRSEVFVIIGWNETMGAVIIQIDKSVGPNSKVVIFSPAKTAYREKFLADSQARRNHQCCNLTVEHMEGPISARFRLEALPLQQANRILLFADNSIESAEEADSQTIATLLQVKDILDAAEDAEATATMQSESSTPRLRGFAGWRPRSGEQESPQARKKVIIPQVLTETTSEIIKRMGINDFINPNHLAAQLLSMISEDPDINNVISEVLRTDGCQFAIRKVSKFPGINQLLERRRAVRGREDEMGISFDELSHCVALSGEIAVGWSAPEEGYTSDSGWLMNPKDRSTRRAVLPSLRIVVMKKSSHE